MVSNLKSIYNIAKMPLLTRKKNNISEIIRNLDTKIRILFLAEYTQLYTGHSMSNHPMVETVPPPQILMKIYTFGLYGQKRRFAK